LKSNVRLISFEQWNLDRIRANQLPIQQNVSQFFGVSGVPCLAERNIPGVSQRQGAAMRHAANHHKNCLSVHDIFSSSRSMNDLPCKPVTALSP
tara:strand:- start:268 stop:549 length:282 start_codon:yes stop_codon:yes gene_type:complete